MKRKSQFCFIGTDLANWKTVKSAGFKVGNTVTSDFFNAMMAASGKAEPVIGLIEFSSEDGLSLNIHTDSWGRHSHYTVQDPKKFKTMSLRTISQKEATTHLDELKQKGHDFSWLLQKLKYD